MERNNSKRCDICNKEKSKSNWSKHIKTKKHLEGIRNSAQREVNEGSTNEEVQIKHCGICNVVVAENEWSEHLKSTSHKNKTKLIKGKLKQKVKSFNIRRQRKRHFNDIDFETDDYIVKVRRNSREMFLNIKNNTKKWG